MPNNSSSFNDTKPQFSEQAGKMSVTASGKEGTLRTRTLDEIMQELEKQEGAKPTTSKPTTYTASNLNLNTVNEIIKDAAEEFKAKLKAKQEQEQVDLVKMIRDLNRYSEEETAKVKVLYRPGSTNPRKEDNTPPFSLQ